MRILLVDADSVIPNLALMKLATYHKSKGDTVELLELKIPYSPHRRKEIKHIPTEKYDQVYCSVVYNKSINYIEGDSIEFGGTGYSLTKVLPQEIDDLEPDYSLYPDNDTSYGFLTRGCIRNCSFCVVPQKEGMIRRDKSLQEIVRHKVVQFLDNNILAYPDHKAILQEIIDAKIRCEFNQGLDIRLLDEENSLLLSQIRYTREYVFAFDDWKYRNLIEKQLELLTWCKPWGLKFFVYINPAMPLSDTVQRIEFLRDRKILPYVMRDISCWESEHIDFYKDIAAWCNQPGFFKNMELLDFLKKRLKNQVRIQNSVAKYEQNKNLLKWSA